MSDPVLVSLITGTLGLLGPVILLILQQRLRREVRAVDAKAGRAAASAEAAATELVTNHGTSTRDAIDRIEALAKDAASSAVTAQEASHRTERHVTDLATSLRSLEHSLDRRTAQSERALDEAVEDRKAAITALEKRIPDVVRDALAAHVETCPLRRPGDTT